jgi:site-specific DNA-cytosine methylase
MELIGLMDLIISGWECQGFSTVGFGEGLSDTRSSLFTDMVRSLVKHYLGEPLLLDVA